MTKCGRVLSIVFLIGLLAPGYALATGQYTFKVPQLPVTPIVVGDYFNVEVYLNVVPGGPTTEFCTADFCVNYNQVQDLIELAPLAILCSTTSPPNQSACISDPSNPMCISQPRAYGGVDEGLFQRQNKSFPPRTCDDDCTEVDFPQAFNCATGTVPECKTPANIPRLNFFVEAGVTYIGDDPVSGDPVFDYPCGIDVNQPFTPLLVATLTFKALKPGCFQFTKGPCSNIVTDCDTGQIDNMTIVNDPNQICISAPAHVPTFSTHGAVICALLIAGFSVLIMRRYRRAERSES